MSMVSCPGCSVGISRQNLPRCQCDKPIASLTDAGIAAGRGKAPMGTVLNFGKPSVLNLVDQFGPMQASIGRGVGGDSSDRRVEWENGKNEYLRRRDVLLRGFSPAAQEFLEEEDYV
jgi:hypothetical protein